jgi:L-amino acid N-acyltransferase YncA
MIRQARTSDASQVCVIYNHYVAATHVTFEEQPVDTASMAGRIGAVLQGLPWLVWEENGEILGYAYATRWRERSAYATSVESTVYLHPDATRRGRGTRLYSALIEELRVRQLHTVIGGIALPNAASMALHQKLGFEKIAHFREVGRKLGRWIDVGYWQLLL